MRVKLFVALFGTILILMGGIVFADDPGQVRDRNQVQNEAKPQSKLQFRNRMLFVDEDGDGICDGLRDHDNDGIPNGQDPDWTRPQDGTGNQFKKGKGGQNGNGNGNRNQNAGNQFVNKNGFRGGNSWNKQSFRQNNPGFGTGICDRTGSKGNARRSGNR